MSEDYSSLFQCNWKNKWTVCKIVNLQLHFEFFIALSHSRPYQGKSIECHQWYYVLVLIWKELVTTLRLYYITNISLEQKVNIKKAIV